MSDDDPFFGGGDSDRTILRPRPGGRRPAQPAAPPQQPGYAPPQQPPTYPPPGGQPYAPPQGAQQGYAPPQPPPAASLGQLGGGVNPLTSAATTLIALLAQLRDSPNHPDPQSLFQHVSNEVRQFEAAARSNGVSPDHVLAARYVLCTAIDETVLNTPWGSQSVWAQQTLLTSFHNDAWGGEKFFQLLDRMITEPGVNLHLLELMYLLIALGFEGKYRIQERGRAELERIHENLYQVIRSQRVDAEPTLSPRWQGLKDHRSRLAQYVPLWVVAASAAGILVLLYLGFSFAIGRASTPATNDIAGLTRGLAVVDDTRSVYVPENDSVDLRTLLADEIAAGSLAIENHPEGQLLVISDAGIAGGMFRSGSADVQPQVEPLLDAIGRALRDVGGSVDVIGHTDDVQMGAFARYADNWELSEARAATVAAYLADYVPEDQLSSTGRESQEPVGPREGFDSVQEWRSANRRVEILAHAEAGRE